MNDTDQFTATHSAPQGQGESSGAEVGLVGDAKTRLSGAAQAQKDGIADQIEGLAKTVHRAGAQFEGQQDWISQAIGQGAAELEGLASALRRKDLGEIASDVRAFAERRPGIFIGLSLAAGFALARFGKIAAADVSRADLPVLSEASRG